MSKKTAVQVANALSVHNGLEAYAWDELGITGHFTARPMQAALASATSFVTGGLVPLLAELVAPPCGRLAAFGGSESHRARHPRNGRCQRWSFACSRLRRCLGQPSHGYHFCRRPTVARNGVVAIRWNTPSYQSFIMGGKRISKLSSHQLFLLSQISERTACSVYAVLYSRHRDKVYCKRDLVCLKHRNR